jgi:hypothetical protein
MAPKTKKKCAHQTCAFKGIEVTTELDRCIGCGFELRDADPLGDILGNIFGSGR